MQRYDRTQVEPFRDHFSSRSNEYATFRPTYPRALIDFAASLAPARRRAWDCATGNGQAALLLADRFEHVIATDASTQQLANAGAHPRVEYRLARAEESGLDEASIDLVTIAQAVHWFDLERFYAEVRRVLVQGGAIAMWCYELTEFEPRIDAAIHRFYSETVGPYWPPERGVIESGYRTLPFPFDEVATPKLAIESEMTLDETLGYLRTWSATRGFIEARGFDPVDAFAHELAPLWGPPSARKHARRPLHVRAGIVR